MSLTPAISPLVGPQMPDEVKIKYLARLSLPELYKSREVCKEWFELSGDNFLWKPIFSQLNPFADKLYTCDESNDIKSEVLCDLQKNQGRIDQVIFFIDNDEQLASFIGNSSLSLVDLRKMLPMERTLHVMRGLRKDCTQLLVHLPKKHFSDMNEYMKEKYKRNDFCEGLLQLIVLNFYRDDKSLPLFLELVKAPLGPFNAGEAMSAALSLIHSAPALNMVINLCGCIVKSHPNLSAFFKTSFNVGNEQIGNNFVPMTDVVSRLLIPKMNEIGLDVTMDDWIKCGFKPPANQ